MKPIREKSADMLHSGNDTANYDGLSQTPSTLLWPTARNETRTKKEGLARIADNSNRGMSIIQTTPESISKK